MKTLNLSKQRKMLNMVMVAIIALLASCSSDSKSTNSNSTASAKTPAAQASTPADNGLGIGPVKKVDIEASVNPTLADEGAAIFESKCTACHNSDDQRKVGPGLKGVTDRRKPEWIMNMILNPDEMTRKDPQAKELLAEYLAPMANQNLTEQEARSILEFLRRNDGK